MELFWEKPNWFDQDKQLQQLKQAPFMRPFPAFDLESGLHVLRGPRQVGKSSWLKTLLKNYPSPHKAFYLSCENLPEAKDLEALLKSLREKRDLILLDEISFVKGWDRVVKHELDSGHVKTMIVTGSNIHDLRRGADQMPGRMKKSQNLSLMPMDFNEYCSMRRLAGWPDENQLSLFQKYFKCGGFPAAVIEAGPQGTEPVEAKHTYLTWLLGDAIKLGKQESYMKDLLAQLAQVMGSAISLQKLSQRTQMGSHHTAQEYIAVLEDCFALRTSYAIDPNTGAFRYRKEKKFYFTDPLLYWVALECCGLKTPENYEEKVAEMVAFEFLHHRAENRKQRMGYYHSSQGEIDFYSHERWALELKWAPVAQNLSKAFKSVTIPTKILWTQNNFLKEIPNDLE